MAAGRENLDIDAMAAPGCGRRASIISAIATAAPASRSGSRRYFGDVVSFQWDEPFAARKVKTDYNIYVFDENGHWMDPLAATFPGFYTTDDNTQTNAPFEVIFLPPFANEVHGRINQSTYQLVIVNQNGGPARHVKYMNINGVGVSERQNAPSIFGHAAARDGQAVGRDVLRESRNSPKTSVRRARSRFSSTRPAASSRHS